MLYYYYYSFLLITHIASHRGKAVGLKDALQGWESAHNEDLLTQ